MVDNVSTASNIFPLAVGTGTARNQLTSAQSVPGGTANLPAVLDITGDLGLPVVVPASSSFTTAILRTYGYTVASFIATLSQNGQVVINKYGDGLGAILADTATHAMTANVQTVFDHTWSGAARQAISYTVTNSGGVQATLSSIVGVLSK